ncbi:hypothetical protein E2553_33175 [Paraburkholderia dipogonis]|uniref:Uncharacterized protein n=1 Tax=Paraburkholderia dipogonis TaxID=1211383 RepID=A0A4Y8MVI8_9BURK|nr:hypothetical protein [Paraburkholderia dipogonis]TFE41517.1 hypothetical protein E2553_33175 [Paraburkholderia dipogonis]
MAVSDDLKFKLIIAGVGVLVVAYAAKKAAGAGQGVIDSVTGALGSAYDSAANAVGEGFTFVANLPPTAWNAAQAPQTNLGPFNSTATSIVNGPSNLLDAASMGMIGGSGGNTGNGGIGAWLWNIVDGNAFKPNGQP